MQAQYDHYQEQLSENHLTLMAYYYNYQRGMGDGYKNSIKSGIQLFQFPDTYTEAYEQQNAEIKLMLAGPTHTTLADARTISQAKLILPSNESSLQNIRWMWIWALTFLKSPCPSLPRDSLRGHLVEFLLAVGYLEAIHASQVNISKRYLSLQIPCYGVQWVLEVPRPCSDPNPADIGKDKSNLQGHPEGTPVEAHSIGFILGTGQGLGVLWVTSAWQSKWMSTF